MAFGAYLPGGGSSWPVPGSFYPPEVEQYATQVQGKVDCINTPLWSTETLTYSGTAAPFKSAQELNFFTRVYTDKVNGNVQVGGMMASPYAYLIRAIRVCPLHGYDFIKDDAGTADLTANILEAVENLFYNAMLTIEIGSKDYGSWPLWMLPAGGGFLVDSSLTHQDTNTAANKQRQWLFLNNGMPDPRAVYVLSKPIFIASQQPFIVRLKTTTGGASANMDLTQTGINLQVIFDGEFFRPVQ